MSWPESSHEIKPAGWSIATSGETAQEGLCSSEQSLCHCRMLSCVRLLAHRKRPRLPSKTMLPLIFGPGWLAHLPLSLRHKVSTTVLGLSLDFQVPGQNLG